MAQLFAICNNSLYNVMSTMAARYGRRYVAILTNDINHLQNKKYRRKLKRAKLFLAGSLPVVLANIKQLNKRRAPLIIFDNPITLRDYPIEFLDNPPENKLIGEFQRAPINYAMLIDAVEKPDEKRHNLTRKKLELLPQIIQEYTVSGFMDKFNSLLYSITTAHNRLEIRSILVRFVFDELTPEAFNNSLQASGVRLNAKSRPLHQAVLDYMATPRGTALRNALFDAVKREKLAAKAKGKLRRTVKYRELSEKHGVDKFDLRNLIILYRAL